MSKILGDLQHWAPLWGKQVYVYERDYEIPKLCIR